MINVFINAINSEIQLPLKVIAVGKNENQLRVERKNGYPAYHCILCKSGRGYLLVNGCQYIVEAGSFFLLKPNQPHEYYPDGADWNTCWVVFEGETVIQVLQQLKLIDNQPKTISKVGSIYMIFNMILNYASNGGISSNYKCSSCLYTFLLDLSYSSYNSDTMTKSLSAGKIDVVVQFIRKNWNKNVGLSEMATIINVTPQYLCKLFKDFLGITPYEYLISYRLQKSKEMMSDKKLSINEISINAGFNDTSYFCSVFKKYEGITPLQFKKIFY